jgi:hypothetical protein
MFAEQIRRAVEASPRVELPKLSAALCEYRRGKGTRLTG